MPAKRAGQPYFEVGRSKFPLIQSDQFKQGDVKLIEAVTGKDWYEWCKLLVKHGLDHALIKQGFFAVAVQRARQATIDEVAAFIDDLPLLEGIKLVVPEVKKDADANPPVEGEMAAT